MPGMTMRATWILLLLLPSVLIWDASARRYRYCSKGCCIHEYCAFHKICYPKTHCELGCPDGTCEDGVCMPPRPCNASTTCAMGHSCSYNFNLGYRTCQYNLDIGSSLCVDRFGNSARVPMD